MSTHAIRTQGDGTEYPEQTAPAEAGRKVVRSTSSSSAAADSEKVDKLGKQYLSRKIQSSPSSIYNLIGQPESVHNFPREVTPKGKKFFLIPKLVPPKATAAAAAGSLRSRNPKLILLEPYRACTSPMIPFKESNNKVRMPKSNKNNLDLNELVRHMNITKESFSSSKLSEVSAGGGDEFSQLRRERDQLESQLKLQMQVNSELKGLLVHCLGDDIQSKVSSLAEDKMKIAEHLSTNTEKIEFLAGQCEVFRSKFLASSLMVEELARWKASLTEKNQHLVTSNQRLLETFASVRGMQIELYQNLKFLSGLKESNLKTSNVVDLTAECLNISQQLVLNFSGKVGMPENVVASNSALDPLTDAQKQALIAIQETKEFLASSLTDAASLAVCNQANQEYRRTQCTQSEDSFEMLDDARDTK